MIRNKRYKNAKPVLAPFGLFAIVILSEDFVSLTECVTIFCFDFDLSKAFK